MTENVIRTKNSWWTKVVGRYRVQLANKAFIRSFALGLSLLFLSFVVNYLASLYAFERISNPVTDIILSNIRSFDVDQIFLWGPLVFWVIAAIFILPKPQKIPFCLKSIALFIIIRSAFITLTHIGPFPTQIALDSGSTDWIANFFHIKPIYAFIFSSGGDLFFSAHTGLPYLMALVCWKERLLRIFCLASSIFFGVIVLMGHLHYSIDVASAFFITYTIYHIALRFFSPDEKHFEEMESTA